MSQEDSIRTTYLETAREIGSDLAVSAIWDSDRCNWIGHEMSYVENRYQLVHKSCNTYFYNGTSGIAKFLNTLYNVSPDNLIFKILEGTLAQIANTDFIKNLNGNYGYYEGKLGVAKTLIDIGSQIGRADLVNSGWEQLQSLLSKQIDSKEIDLLNGVAGAIPALIDLRNRYNQHYLLDHIVRLANFLVESATKTGEYWSWQSIVNKNHLTGYSHGSAGIASALLEVYNLTRNQNYLSAAQMGFNHERRLFNAQHGNWPDLRDFEDLPVNTTGPKFGDSWCHGAPGIALSRIRAFQITNDETFKNEALTALNTTYWLTINTMNRPNMYTNFSLCHGLAGNAEILLIGGMAFNMPNYIQAAHQIAQQGIQQYRNNKLKWPSGVRDMTGAFKDKTISPGLMLGYSGTGYFYLRMYDPDQIASVLYPQ